MQTLLDIRPFALIARAGLAALVLVGPTQASSSNAGEAHWRGRGAPTAAVAPETTETTIRAAHNRGRTEADGKVIQETETVSAPAHNRGRHAGVDRDEAVAAVK